MAKRAKPGGNEKTNVMRMLEQHGVLYSPRWYDPEITEGVSVAELLGQEAGRVFKTLVSVANTGMNYVFVIPVAETLDLKKAAKAAGVKSIAMIKQKELLPLTGYIHGGCSPMGMKKPFPTFIDESAVLYDRICVSAGRTGAQVELSPDELAELVGASFLDLTEQRT